MTKEKKLGRGISALIGESKTSGKVPVNSNQQLVEKISLDKIIAGIYQPRSNFKESEIAELAESIKENGIIQPILLRKITTDEEVKYEIIAGERRFRASKVAGLTEIPAIVKKLNNHEALELALIENIQREDLSVIEEAAGYQRLMDEFSYSQEQISKKVGKSRSHVANLLRLLSLPKSVQIMVDNGAISMGHARAIIGSDEAEDLAEKIVAESLTVRDIENLSRDEKVRKKPSAKKSEKPVANSAEIKQLEKELSELSNMKSTIAYNVLKDSGMVTFKFDDLHKVYELLATLEVCSKK